MHMEIRRKSQDQLEVSYILALPHSAGAFIYADSMCNISTRLCITNLVQFFFPAQSAALVHTITIRSIKL